MFRDFALVGRPRWPVWPAVAGALSAPPGAPLRASTCSTTPIDAEVIAQYLDHLPAKAAVRFIPLDDNVTSATFELNNALNVSRVVDDQGKQIPASRNQQDFTVRLSFDQPLPKGQPVTVTFYYDGTADGPGGFAGLRHQVRRHPSRFRVT